MSPFASMDMAEPLLSALRLAAGSVNDTEYPCRPVTAHTSERTITLARFCGHVELAGLGEFSSALHDLVTEQVQKIILDMHNLTLDRSALGALVGFASATHGRNKRLYIYRPTYQIIEELRQTDLEFYFVFLQTEEDLLSKLIV